jgi:hypothetical protein
LRRFKRPQAQATGRSAAAVERRRRATLAEAERKLEQHLVEVMSEHIRRETASQAPNVTKTKGKKMTNTSCSIAQTM